MGGSILSKIQDPNKQFIPETLQQVAKLKNNENGDSDLVPAVVVFSPNSGYTEGVLTVRVKAGFDQGTRSGPVVSSA